LEISFLFEKLRIWHLKEKMALNLFIFSQLPSDLQAPAANLN